MVLEQIILNDGKTRIAPNHLSSGGYFVDIVDKDNNMKDFIGILWPEEHTDELTVARLSLGKVGAKYGHVMDDVVRGFTKTTLQLLF